MADRLGIRDGAEVKQQGTFYAEETEGTQDGVEPLHRLSGNVRNIRNSVLDIVAGGLDVVDLLWIQRIESIPARAYEDKRSTLLGLRVRPNYRGWMQRTR